MYYNNNKLIKSNKSNRYNFSSCNEEKSIDWRVKNHNIYNNVTSGFLIYRNNCILLVKGKLSNKWGFPKGHIATEETSIKAAIREVKEETGINIPLDRKYNYIRVGRLKLYVISLDYDPTINVLDKDEIEACEWFNLYQLMSIHNIYDIDEFNSPIKYVIKMFQNNNSLLHKIMYNISI